MDEIRLVRKDELYHYGVKGMKWGHRKNPEVAAARQTYKSAKKDWNRSYNKAYNYSARHPISQYTSKKKRAESDKRWDDAQTKLKTYDKAKADYKQAKQDYRNSPEGQAAAAKRKKALKVGAAVAGTALAVYGGYKVNKYVKTKNMEIAAEKGYESAKKMFNEHVSTMEAYKSNVKNPVHSYTYTVNAGKIAKDRADVASKTKFKQAARAVRQYKKSGGDLKNLRKVESYGGLGGHRDIFEYRYNDRRRK